ncbi:MAG: efflux RND transporter periplasmic adaptor subunit [Gammaproteobacteria bacterium]|nr:efflux RND transporter periplasmic adaptor subunit [Gammaproteobacteria bacterium]
MSRNIWFALAILVLAISWFAFDFLVSDEVVASNKTIAQIQAETDALIEDLPATKVRGRISTAKEMQRTTQLSGRTENKRTVQVRAEVGGLVVQRAVELGVQVSKGDALCVLEQEEREARVREAKDMFREAQLEYAGQTSLRASGLQIERQIAAAKARVTQAETMKLQREKELARATIKAPFDGFIEEVHAEIGDLLQPGAACVTLIDLDPMKVVAKASEKEIHNFTLDAEAQARLPSGDIIAGTISFIGQQSDQKTRSFTIEMLVDNPDFAIRSGLTAELLIPLDSYEAHKIPVALLGLMDNGDIGVRIVGDRDRVEFLPINIVTEDTDGVWVTGLPEVSTLITVGQEFVVVGETVEVTFEEDS